MDVAAGKGYSEVECWIHPDDFEVIADAMLASNNAKAKRALLSALLRIESIDLDSAASEPL